MYVTLQPKIIFYIFILFFIARQLSAEDNLRIIHTGTVAPDIIEIVIRAGKVEYGKQIPYEKHPLDEIQKTFPHQWVVRNKNPLGSLAGSTGNILYTFDKYTGIKLNDKWIRNIKNYRIKSFNDPSYSTDAHPNKVFYKYKPFDLGRVSAWEFEACIEYCIYLKLPEKLKKGSKYLVKFYHKKMKESKFLYEPGNFRSSAVHVSQIGFSPDDPVKKAFLSCWMGTGKGLEYKKALSFNVINNETEEVVFKGKIQLSKAGDDKTEDAYKKNYNLTDVFIMDFSSVTTPGTYRVYVNGVGCSFPFIISNQAWQKAYIVSMKGLYHQRSGIELGPPYTAFKRPRNFHPKDNVRIYTSRTPLWKTGNGLNKKDSNFGNLVKGRTKEMLSTNAWGGYMDAGDWDRRIQHLDAARFLFELESFFPEYFNNLNLNIPESNNDLPDIIDEALFNLDFYKRLQTPEGGIRGGIESAEHPCYGETSWQESLDIIAYAPGIYSSYYYAGVACRAVAYFRKKDSKLAKIYLNSALNAMQWAEKQHSGNNDYPHEINDARNLAAAELYRIIGDEKWHKIFLDTTIYHESNVDMFKWKHHEQKHSAWVYIQIEHEDVDKKVQKNCKNALLKEAEERIVSCDRTGFKWAKYEWMPMAGSLSSPDAVSLVRAHRLTRDKKYLKYILLSCQAGAGANPNNMCYTTGVGQNYPQHPLNLDSRITHQEPPAGLTVLGPLDPGQMSQKWAQKIIDKNSYPAPKDWPVLENYWDVFWFPMVCEYTIHVPMARNIYTWGYLAALSYEQIK